MRRLLFLISCLLCMGLSAQNARKVLDTAASKIKKSGDVEVSFTAHSKEPQNRGARKVLCCSRERKCTWIPRI